MDQALPSKYNLWLFDVKDKQETNAENFYEKVKNVLTINTLNDFTTMYSRLRKPKDMRNGSEVFFFKENIKPLWEDPGNKNGGSFFLHIKKTFANRIWENLLFSIVSEQPEELRAVNGIIIRVLTLEVVFFIWTRQLTKDQEARMITWLKETSGLSNKIKLEFKPHPKGDKADKGETKESASAVAKEESGLAEEKEKEREKREHTPDNQW